MAEGIEVRHVKDCRLLTGGRCNCDPSYRASVWSPRDRKLIRRTFPTRAAAKVWRSDAEVALRKGTLRAPEPTTIREAADAWLEGARAGTIRNRSGDPYKPSAIRGYEKALRLRVVPRFGPVQLSELRHTELQDFVDEMLAKSLSASTIKSTLNPLRAVYRRAVARGHIAVNPVRDLELPAIRSRRDRIASPDEAERLLRALPEGDRAVWATAMYAGLRRGELMALEWSQVDLATGLLHVEAGWDTFLEDGRIEPKSEAGRRKVPIAAVLRDYLDEHRLRGAAHSFVFGSDDEPFDPKKLSRRADKAWANAELERITLHECRHTFASLMIAAGVNAKALSTYMGHANISITLDRYGHLMPGNEEQAASLLDKYLDARAARSGKPQAEETADDGEVSDAPTVR
jgi:integrase